MAKKNTDIRISLADVISKNHDKLDSKYVDKERKDYSIYTLESRAIPALTDGLKAAARRVLWTARSGQKFKSATLAGATLPIHPHDAPESAINTAAGKYINNICYLDGEGAFGTRLVPKGAFGAGRYTSVKASKFTQDVIFADIDIIPMKDNYDLTLKEPVHFLPLVPTILVNPAEGVTIGFASTILPRKLDEIIADQIAHLKDKKIKNRTPTITFYGADQVAESVNDKWVFRGEYKIEDRFVTVSNLPYGVDHGDFIEFLDGLHEKAVIRDYTDRSSDTVNIEIKMCKSEDKKEIPKILRLHSSVSENITIIDLDHKTVLTPSYSDIVSVFTEWRLSWFYKRFDKQMKELETELVRHVDILQAAYKQITLMAPKLNTKEELVKWLLTIGIVNLDYIASLPTYRFTKDEVLATKKRCEELRDEIEALKTLIKDEDAVKNVYISELEKISANFKKGKYATSE